MTKKLSIGELCHHNDDTEPMQCKAAGSEDDSKWTAANNDRTKFSTTTVSKQDPITKVSKIKKSFAPSIEAYLNQGRQTISTARSPIELEYLPRPEWCKPYYLLLATNLEEMNNPYWMSFNLLNAATMSVNDYAAHFK
jgi:hypothetical protein